MKNFNFINPTLKFCAAGLFIPGFTAIIILGMQMAISFLGIECSNSWKVLWWITSFGTILLPILFIRKFTSKIKRGVNLTTIEITVFNIIEYTFIQCALAAYFSNPNTLCYVTDGQNGLEFVFTAWMATPLLVVLSLIFDSIRKSTLQEVQ